MGGWYFFKRHREKGEVGDLVMPGGDWHVEDLYVKCEIYRERLSGPVRVNQADKGATGPVRYEVAADAGFCYPPETKVVPLSEVKAAASPLPSGEMA
ncbi:protein-disulfide reductase DsbD domain-containing protein, partial [Enterobacter hormaechei]